MTTVDHLSSFHDTIAMSLDENVYGANGDMDTEKIRAALMEAIVARCNYHIAGHSGVDEDFIEMSVAEHEHQPAITLSQAAFLIYRVWKHKDHLQNMEMTK